MSIFGAVFFNGKHQQILPNVILTNKGPIPAVPLGGHFKYLGKIFDFESLDSVPKRNFEDKLVNILDKLSSLNIKCQTKLKIFATYVPTQFLFELKIYNFTDAFLTGVIDRICSKHIRDWLEFPASSCVKEWVSSPTSYCGLGIPTFAQRAARMKLTRRHTLKTSKNISIREIWESSVRSNILTDSRLEASVFWKASSALKESQDVESLAHFLGLKSQGMLAKTVSETVLPKNIHHWKHVMDSLPEHIHNFARKAMMKKLPTLKNLKLWNCSHTDLCPRCGLVQSNKHVLSHCSSPDSLARYTNRHNKILLIIAGWIAPHMGDTKTLYYDLNIPGAQHVADLFKGFRPDLAVVLKSKIVIGELTVCHESNLQKSREYKLRKYATLAAARSSAFKSHAVSVHTIEVSTLGFVVAEPDFFKFEGFSSFNATLLEELSKTAILSSRDIYCNR